MPINFDAEKKAYELAKALAAVEKELSDTKKKVKKLKEVLESKKGKLDTYCQKENIKRVRRCELLGQARQDVLKAETDKE
jgi:hypothetical protein